MVKKQFYSETAGLSARSFILRFFMICCLAFIVESISAAEVSKSNMITLEINKGTYSDVFKAIEKQSDYKFFYNSDQVDLTKTVEVKAEGSSIENVLNQVFKGTSITYRIVNNHVVLTNNNTNEKAINQQSRRISGKVYDSNGESLIGVNVVVKGTNQGSITDINGSYSLDDIPANAVLVFSYIGYNTMELPASQAARVIMQEDTKKLDEVVVVGYGSFRKRDLTGAVSQVKGDEISNLPLRSASDALQGKAAGVTITSTSGSPGSMGTVRIRGVGTINDNNPLYVVDGLPQSDIGWLNPRDIESMEVLKDASAQAIYGVQSC